MKARLGKAEGITATAHKLARILYAVITRRVPYHEDEAFKQTPASKNRRLLNLHKQAAKLGFQLTPQPNSPPCYSGGGMGGVERVDWQRRRTMKRNEGGG